MQYYLRITSSYFDIVYFMLGVYTGPGKSDYRKKWKSKIDRLSRYHDMAYERLGTKAYFLPSRADRHWISRAWQTPWYKLSVKDNIARLGGSAVFGAKQVLPTNYIEDVKENSGKRQMKIGDFGMKVIKKRKVRDNAIEEKKEEHLAEDVHKSKMFESRVYRTGRKRWNKIQKMKSPRRYKKYLDETSMLCERLTTSSSGETSVAMNTVGWKLLGNTTAGASGTNLMCLIQSAWLTKYGYNFQLMNVNDATPATIVRLVDPTNVSATPTKSEYSDFYYKFVVNNDVLIKNNTSVECRVVIYQIECIDNDTQDPLSDAIAVREQNLALSGTSSTLTDPQSYTSDFRFYLGTYKSNKGGSMSSWRVRKSYMIELKEGNEKKFSFKHAFQFKYDQDLNSYYCKGSCMMVARIEGKVTHDSSAFIGVGGGWVDVRNDVRVRGYISSENIVRVRRQSNNVVGAITLASAVDSSANVVNVGDYT